MDSNVDSSSAVSQKLLEQNEDMIGAIVENLQLGRLEESMQLYLVLQGNLNVLAAELDSYPMENTNVYDEMHKFPDKIMRKSCLEDLLPFEEKYLLSTPIMPPCQECFGRNFSAYQCRVTLQHSQELNPRLGHHEQQEALRAAQVLLARQRQQISQDKRGYKKWSTHEKYTLCIGIKLYGQLSYEKLRLLIPGRSEKQIKNFITKQLKDVSAIPGVEDLVSRPPPGYTPPPYLTHLFSSYSNSANGAGPSSATDLLEQSVIADVKNDFVGMVGIAMGLEMHIQSGSIATASPSSSAASVMHSAGMNGSDDKQAEKGDAVSKSIRHEDTAKRAAMLLESYQKKDMSKAGSNTDTNAVNASSSTPGPPPGGSGALPYSTNAPKRNLPAFALPGLKRLQQAQSVKSSATGNAGDNNGEVSSSVLPIASSAALEQSAAGKAAYSEPGVLSERPMDRSKVKQSEIEMSSPSTDARKKTPLVRRKKACIPVEVVEPLGLIPIEPEVDVEASSGRGSPKQVKKKNSRENAGGTQVSGASAISKKKPSTKKAKDGSSAPSTGGTKSLLSQVQENIHNGATSGGSELPPVDYYADGSEGILIEDIGEGFSFF